MKSNNNDYLNSIIDKIDSFINPKRLKNIGLFWFLIAFIYTIWLYQGTNPPIYIHDGLEQTQIRDNLDEFGKLINIFLIPIGLISLGLTYYRYKEDREQSKKKSAHDLVIKALKDVYQIRSDLSNSINESDLYYIAKNIEKINQEQQNNINFLLNFLEYICIAISEKIIDDKIIDLNLIYILAEYRFLFEEYIENEGKPFNNLNQEYKPWGVLTIKIDEIVKYSDEEKRNNEHKRKLNKLVTQVRENVAAAKNQYSKIFLKLTPRPKKIFIINNELNKFKDNLEADKRNIINASIFQDTTSILQTYFVIVYLKTEKTFTYSKYTNEVTKYFKISSSNNCHIEKMLTINKTPVEVVNLD